MVEISSDRVVYDRRAAAVEEGMEAHVSGLRREDNPYAVGSPMRVFWERGWMIGEKYGDAH